MSTTTETQTQDASAEAAPAFWDATLIRGRVYMLPEQTFERDVPQKVDHTTKLWLEEHAVDMVSVENEGEHQARPKFRFAPHQPPQGGAKASAARSRTR